MMYQPGDIALVHETGPVALGIQYGTRSRYNHVRLVVDTMHGRVVEAKPGGAARGHVGRNDVVVRPPLTWEQRAKIPAIAASLLGTPYGFLDVAALGLAQVGIVLPGVKHRIARPDRLFCSQLVDYAWTLAGFHAFTDDRTPQDVSPGDLADLAFRQGWGVVKHG
jgi:hypothetical protein